MGVLSATYVNKKILLKIVETSQLHLGSKTLESAEV
jgi:hypothetical protein